MFLLLNHLKKKKFFFKGNAKQRKITGPMDRNGIKKKMHFQICTFPVGLRPVLLKVDLF